MSTLSRELRWGGAVNCPRTNTGRSGYGHVVCGMGMLRWAMDSHRQYLSQDESGVVAWVGATTFPALPGGGRISYCMALDMGSTPAFRFPFHFISPSKLIPNPAITCIFCPPPGGGVVPIFSRVIFLWVFLWGFPRVSPLNT